MMSISRRFPTLPSVWTSAQWKSCLVGFLAFLGTAACSGRNPTFFPNVPKNDAGSDGPEQALEAGNEDVSVDDDIDSSVSPPLPDDAAPREDVTPAGRCTTCEDGTPCDATPNGCATCTECDAGSPVARCAHASDCADAGKNDVCDGVTGQCVQCTVAADCRTGQDCVNRQCVSQAVCTSDLACSRGRVCDTARRRCVNCITNANCGPLEACVASECYRTCSSGGQCTPFGLFCDAARGVCTQCLKHDDCAPGQFCSSGHCVADVCKAGSSTCGDGGVATCNAEGSGYSPAVDCPAEQSCMIENGNASCRSKACAPSQNTCDQAGQKVLRCSADGLSQMVLQDCAANSQVCIDASCKARVCTPGQKTCEGNAVHQCNTTGSAESVEPCTPLQFCDPETPACRPRVCTPNRPACSGNAVTTCNALGSASLDAVPGAGCGTKTCVDGQCAEALFHEDFESGLSGWALEQGEYAVLGTTRATAAIGTGTSLILSKTGSKTTTSADGYRHLLSKASQRPRAIGVWLRRDASTTTGHTYVVLSPTTDLPSMGDMESLLHIEIFGSNNCSIYVGGRSPAEACSTGEWHHVELRKLDWESGTYDFYLEGVEVAKSIPIPGFGRSPGGANAIKRIDLFNHSATVAYVDQIDFLAE